ncbi:MAG TPA: sensor histidine kinase [Acidimicrobiales bacterium]|nr:sensor histidine kinase [Acidimicrobiales bacterium]
MGIRDKFQTEVSDFKSGFNDAVDDEPWGRPEISNGSDRLIQMFAYGTRVILFGFLLALPGVPLLPWGKPAAMATTAVAAMLASVYVGTNDRIQIVRLAAVAILFACTLRFGTPPTTSMILVGAVATSVAALASSYPGVYVGTAVAAIAVVIVGTFDLNLLDARQLPLSGSRFTPDRFMLESLRFVCFMFLSGILHFGRTELQRLQSKASEAVAARDAAISDERARIARELHDVVSHHVTAMTLQAEAAAITGDKNALTAVASAGREALTELRRMLGVLRHPDAGDAAGGLDPQPGLEQLDALARRTSSGPAVRVERLGNVRPLSAGLELGVYRLVQEALTNCAKHSDADTVDVVLTYGETELTVEVRDNGRPLVAARVGSSGLGLVGMQERIALLNGELSTGPRTDGAGFVVSARLPVDE